MSVRIRLRRIGKRPRARPFFRITVMDTRKPRDGKFIEEIGLYEPTRKPPFIKMNKERFDYWVKQGARPTETVLRLAKKLVIL